MGSARTSHRGGGGREGEELEELRDLHIDIGCCGFEVVLKWWFLMRWDP